MDFKHETKDLCILYRNSLRHCFQESVESVSSSSIEAREDDGSPAAQRGLLTLYGLGRAHATHRISYFHYLLFSQHEEELTSLNWIDFSRHQTLQLSH